MGRGRNFERTAIAIATVALGSAELSAQSSETNRPASAVLGLETRVEIDNNRFLSVTSPGTTVSVSEILTFGLNSETRTQALNFELSGALRFLDSPIEGTSFEFDDPGLLLSYSRESANANISGLARYDSRDVSDTGVDEGVSAADLIIDTGTVDTFGASLDFAMGTSDPLGLSVSTSYDETDYSGTTDPDLVDSSSWSISASANMRISPVTQGTFTAASSLESVDSAGDRETEETSFSFGVDHELRRGLTIGAALGFRTIETTEFAAVSETDGLFAELGATQELKDGTIFGSVEFDGSGGTDSYSLTFGRTREMSDGSLSASLTASHDDDIGTQLSGALDYALELPTGEFTVGISQEITSNAEDEDVRFSSLGLGYTQAINSVSGFGIDLDLSRSEVLGSDETTTRADLTATYRRELTADWDMSVGYRHRQINRSSAADADSDAIFLTLSRDLALGF